jgi:hypothetical protein
MAKFNISEKANDPNYVSPYETGDGKYQSDGNTQTIYQERQGITTSDSASKAVDSARDTLNDIGSNSGATSDNTSSATIVLLNRISNLRTELEESQKQEELAKKNLTDADLQSKLEAAGSSEEVTATGDADLEAGVDALNKAGAGETGVTSDFVDNPILRGITDATLNTVSTIQAQLTRLGDFRNTMSDYSQAEIDDISATAERAVQRQIEENARVKRSMEFAGVVGGRAQFAPTVQSTIIHEIVQAGLDEINVIEDNKNTAIRQARQAEAEFDYQIFTDSVELAKEYHKEIENGITKLKAEVRQAEQDEQDRITFNQSQQERNALILAEELVDATQEKIAETAAANGVDLGLLMKAVNDAKFEKSNRSLTLANQRKGLAGDSDTKISIPKDVEQGFRSVARLSKGDSESAWLDIQDFGLDDSVAVWLDEGRSKAQVKAMVSAHEQSQRSKDEDGIVQPTASESTLHTFIDNWKSPEEKKEENTPKSKFGGDIISSPETFFKDR